MREASIINHFQERALRVAYKDEISDVKRMFKKGDNVTIRVKKLHILVSEIFKTQHSFNPTIMRKIFVSENNQCAFRNEHLSPF